MTDKYIIFSLIAAASLYGCAKNNTINNTESSVNQANQNESPNNDDGSTKNNTIDNTESPADQSSQTESQYDDDDFCMEGNCPCGDGACAQGARCINGMCICGEDKWPEWDEERPDAWEGDPPEYSVSAKGNMFGEFVCGEEEQCGTSACATQYQFVCENPDGCHIGTRHFNAGYRTEKAFSKGDLDVYNYMDDFHYDGAIEPGDEFGYSCIIPTKTGQCGMDFEMHEADEHLPVAHRFYNHSLCKGGTQLCNAKGQKPAKIPENAGDNVYECSEVWSYGPMAWLCNKKPCPCGNMQCPRRYSCVDGQCVFYEDYQAQYEDGHIEICSDGNGHDEIIPADPNGWSCMPSYENMSKAWTCLISTCICNDKICTKDMICANNECITPAAPKYIQHEQQLAKARNKPYHSLYDYTKEPKKLDRCGRESAENVAQRTDWVDKSIPILGINKPETDRCRVRQNCDTWGVPRNHRNQYVCDHGLYVKKAKNGKIATADRPLGLRCIDPDGCVCHETKCPMNSLCLYDNSFCVFDSVYKELNHADRKTDWTNPDSVYEFWRHYGIDYNPFASTISGTKDGKPILL